MYRRKNWSIELQAYLPLLFTESLLFFSSFEKKNIGYSKANSNIRQSVIIGDGFFWGGASEGGYRNVRQSMIIGDSFGGESVWKGGYRRTEEVTRWEFIIYVLQSLSWLVCLSSGNTKWMGLQDACKKREMHTKF